jgi:hypothetical protein
LSLEISSSHGRCHKTRYFEKDKLVGPGGEQQLGDRRVALPGGCEEGSGAVADRRVQHRPEAGVVRRLKEELNLDWDSKFSDLNLDLILNLVLLPKNFKMENHENHAPRAIARIKCRNSCTGTMMQLHGTCQLNL